jgi:hypothetical protein
MYMLFYEISSVFIFPGNYEINLYGFEANLLRYVLPYLFSLGFIITVLPDSMD